MRRPQAAVAPASFPAVPAVPGLAEAKAALAVRRECELDIALGIHREQQARREAEGERRRLMSALARGEDVPPAAFEAADAAIADGEARVAHRQEALPEAEAETKRAEKVMAAVMREELRRRVPRVEAAAREAKERWITAQVAFGRLDVLRADSDRAARAAHSAADLDAVLARTAEFAGAVSGEAESA